MEVVWQSSASDWSAVRVVRGDLTEAEADVIVNAANGALAHGGGVAAALARAGGPAVQEESDRYVAEHGAIATGAAGVTGAGRLRARWLVHTVGPVWGASGGGSAEDERLLASAVTSALDAAHRLGATSLAMPAISTGIYGFPKPLAAQVTVAAIADWSEAHPASALRRIDLVLWDAPSAALFAAEAERRWPGAREPASR